MHRRFNPPDVAAPLGAYSHGLEVAKDCRWVFVSGQLGIGPDGVLAESAEAQADLAWSNVLKVLAAAGMGVADLVKVTTFVVDRGLIPAVRAARQKYLPGPGFPSTTFLVVAGLARPEFLVEIEAVAARAA
ncbi:MAG: RidA family protein [Alphaproteobacteria bacterium]|nr:RidA family protein [Alphaproteobacteria bacterium]